MPKNGAEVIYRELDAAIILGIRRDWQFRNPDTGQVFILTLRPIDPVDSHIINN